MLELFVMYALCVYCVLRCVYVSACCLFLCLTEKALWSYHKRVFVNLQHYSAYNAMASYHQNNINKHPNKSSTYDSIRSIWWFHLLFAQLFNPKALEMCFKWLRNPSFMNITFDIQDVTWCDQCTLWRPTTIKIIPCLDVLNASNVALAKRAALCFQQAL